MFELQHLTPQERIEYFEQGLRDVLSVAKTHQIPAESQNSRVETLLKILRQTWSAQRATCWNVSAQKLAAIHNWENLNRQHPHQNVDPVDPATQRLIELSANRSGILWVEPSATKQGRRALGRIPWTSNLTECVVIELEYESKSASDLPVPRDAILHGLEHCLQMLARYAASHFLRAPAATSYCSAIDQMAIDAFHQRRRLCQELSSKLGTFAGQTLPTLIDKQAFVRSVHALLDENALRLECPTCGEPSILRCMKTGNSLQGCYLFDHRIGGKRTMHGGRSEIPVLIVTDKPLRAKRKVVVTQVQPTQ